ncbi:class I SAM-dependent methyltransferase [Planctomycetota bacterium]
MQEDLVKESKRLRAAWMKYDADHLDRYLVSDLEDPRVNLQSILIRSFLIDAVFPHEFTTLIRQEFRFSICMNFILRLLKNSPNQVSRVAIFDALENRRKKYGNFKIPAYMHDNFNLICNSQSDIPDYISLALMDRLIDGDVYLPGSALSCFEQLWRDVLHGRSAERISVLEPACGSANDYRYLESYGMARFLKYVGFDICPKNIANARRRYPKVRFETGNILDMPFDDNQFGYLFLHDLLEHLSPAALEIALAQLARVTRREACLNFFNMDVIDEHIIKPVKLYHWNTLSKNKICETLMRYAADIDIVPIDSFLRENYHCDDYYNQQAYTLIVSFE